MENLGGRSYSQAPLCWEGPCASTSAATEGSWDSALSGPWVVDSQQGGRGNFSLNVSEWPLGWHIPLSGEESDLRHWVPGQTSPGAEATLALEVPGGALAPGGDLIWLWDGWGVRVQWAMPPSSLTWAGRGSALVQPSANVSELRCKTMNHTEESLPAFGPWLFQGNGGRKHESSWSTRSPGKQHLGRLDRHGCRMVTPSSEGLSAGVRGTSRLGTSLSWWAAWLGSGPSGISKSWRVQRNGASHETGGP